MARSDFRVAVAQLNCTVGDIHGNSQKIIVAANESYEADLLVTPELSLIGYPPKDLLLKPHFITEQIEALHELAKKLRVPTLVGFVHREGEQLFNAVALLRNKKVEQIFEKSLLPTYDVFDERRYFTPRHEVKYPVPMTFLLNDIRIGVTICEDMWDEGYDYKPMQAVMAENPDLIINVSASPWHQGKFAKRLYLARQHFTNTKCAFIYCNMVGAQDELIFDGASFALNNHSQTNIGCPCIPVVAWKEQIASVFPFGKTTKLPEYHDITIGDTFQALVLGVRDYIRKSGFTKAVLGVSGGVDSALVLAIAVEALGAENVLGVTMPSKYNSSATYDDSFKICKNLGVRCVSMPIQDSIDIAIKRYETVFGTHQNKVTIENLQARERGKILMEISNDTGALVLSTGNKTEMALGYATLYGDMCGGLAVIGDLDKIEVYDMIDYINRSIFIGQIPQGIIKRKPSAELASGQVDPFDYDKVSPIVESIVERHVAPQYLYDGKYIPESEVDRLYDLIRIAEYKRQQAPPILKISPKSFGSGRQMPIVNKYRW